MILRLSHPLYQGQVLRNLGPIRDRCSETTKVQRSDLRKRRTGTEGTQEPESPSCTRVCTYATYAGSGVPGNLSLLSLWSRQ